MTKRSTAPKRRKTDHESPPAPVLVTTTTAKGLPTIYGVRAYAELLGNGAPVVKYVIETYGRAARPVLLRYTESLTGAKAKEMAEAMEEIAPANRPGAPDKTTLTVNGEGRVTVNARAIAPPKGRVRVELRKLDGVDAIVIFKAKRATDLS